MASPSTGSDFVLHNGRHFERLGFHKPAQTDRPTHILVSLESLWKSSFLRHRTFITHPSRPSFVKKNPRSSGRSVRPNVLPLLFGACFERSISSRCCLSCPARVTLHHTRMGAGHRLITCESKNKAIAGLLRTCETPDWTCRAYRSNYFGLYFSFQILFARRAVVSICSSLRYSMRSIFIARATHTSCAVRVLRFCRRACAEGEANQALEGEESCASFLSPCTRGKNSHCELRKLDRISTPAQSASQPARLKGGRKRGVLRVSA